MSGTSTEKEALHHAQQAWMDVQTEGCTVEPIEAITPLRQPYGQHRSQYQKHIQDSLCHFKAVNSGKDNYNQWNASFYVHSK